MVLSLAHSKLIDTESEILTFFRCSEGDWRSQRRYYSLKQGSVQEVVSLLSNRFLSVGDEALEHLAQLHLLADGGAFVCGMQVTWESDYVNSNRKQATGTTMFGVKGDVLYRDRGFATGKPVTASYHFSTPQTLHLRTEYGGSVFEEEIKLVGDNYRTRQTIITKAGEEQMVGQYLETRLR
ncbi:MAG: phycobiliprotein lyase [Cyanobacteria bacterium P01_D01_bin.123]